MKPALDYTHLCAIPALNAKDFPERESHKFKKNGESESRTWSRFYQDIQYLSAGFSIHGIGQGTHTAFFCDNRYEWGLTDYALMSRGAVSVPRGSDTTAKELCFIYEHSDSRFLIMENTLLLASFLKEWGDRDQKTIEKILIMDAGTDKPDEYPGVAGRIVYYSDLLASGRAAIENRSFDYEKELSRIKTGDMVTIIYTSGTSGNPKGVMLSHSNFLHNVRAISPLLNVDRNKGERTVSILPSWHVYERAFEYCSAALAMTIVYSSIKNFTEDLASEHPTIVCSVPRVWESFYERINDKLGRQSPVKKALFGLFLAVGRTSYLASNALQGFVLCFQHKNIMVRGLERFAHTVTLALLKPLNRLAAQLFKPMRDIMGGNLRASISGGGSLSPQVDLFFNTVGITLLNAYGMTESSPGTITRRLDRNTIGSIGIPLAETEVRIAHEDGTPCRPGEKGIIQVKGPQVMMGYYRNPEATAAVLSPDGWLNTGDIGMKSLNGDHVITGRAKSTIVLVGGENIEPEPIEEKLKESVFIDHAVIVGQDRKNIAALIVINEEKLRHLAEKWKISWDEMVAKSSDIIQHNRIIQEIRKEIGRLVNHENGFRQQEQVRDIVVIKRPFTIGEELTQTLKVKRQYVAEKYSEHLEKIR